MTHESTRRRHNINRAIIALASAAIVMLAMIPARPAEGSQSARDRGALVFQQKGCTRCHGASASSDDKGPDLSNVGRRLHKKQIEHQILDGGQQMPAFRDALTPQETHDLVAYLSHLKTKH